MTLAGLKASKPARSAKCCAQKVASAQARHAHELLGKGGVTGKIVLVANGAL
jgi:hypothetical protein